MSGGWFNDLFDGWGDFTDPDEIDRIEALAAEKVSDYERRLAEIDARIADINNFCEEERARIDAEYEATLDQIEADYEAELERINTRRLAALVVEGANQTTLTRVNWRKDGF